MSVIARVVLATLLLPALFGVGGGRLGPEIRSRFI